MIENLDLKYIVTDRGRVKGVNEMLPESIVGYIFVTFVR